VFNKSVQVNTRYIKQNSIDAILERINLWFLFSEKSVSILKGGRRGLADISIRFVMGPLFRCR
jgi:hypothetical protein